MGKLFGTDGVRGVANRDLTGELAFRLGRAAVIALTEHGEMRPEIAVGRDTRASGEFLEAAVAAGVCSAGGDALLLGVCTTPGVAFLTTDLGAQAGCVISASHNPADYNGIKFFEASGYKLPDVVEDEIEGILEDDHWGRPVGRGIGRVLGAPDSHERYLQHLVGTAGGVSLSGMRVVVDCANGGAYEMGPELLRRLGAETIPINDKPDGWNINQGAGATHPEVIALAVADTEADAGLSVDGDADRAIFAGPGGSTIDGDNVVVASALDLHERGELNGDLVVTTVMANLGLRRALADAGIRIGETSVGDRYVLEEMLRSGAVLGGEQSGHVIFLRHATTGDGLLTAVQFLTLAARKGCSVVDLASTMQRFPQVLENVPVADPVSAAGTVEVEEAVARAEQALGDRGRVLVRPSGTEPVVRVMVEAPTEEEARGVAAQIVASVRKALA